MSEKRELSRAEQVRARRSQSVTQAMTQSSSRVVKPFVNTVTSRVNTSYVQPKRVETSQKKFGLSFPEIKLRAPVTGVRRPRDSWRVASFLLTVLFGATIYLAWTLVYFRIPNATVLGNQRLTQEEINAVLGVANESIFAVNPNDVATRLRLNYPELSSAEVKVYLPNHVYVNVSERQPVIRWQQGDGFTWIDATGVAFRPRGDVSGLISVVALANPPTGIASLDDPMSPPPFIEKDLVDAILTLASSVPAGSNLTFDPQEGLGWKDNRGWNVYFGLNAQNVSMKLRVYQSLVDSLVSKGKTPVYINVAYADAPYYRMSEIAGTDATTSESGQ